MNLSKWYLKNSTKPLLNSIVVLVGILMFFNSILYLKEQEQASQALNDVVELASLGLSQKNRVLVESTLNLAVNNLQISQIVLCENGRILFTHPSNSKDCSVTGTSFFSKTIRKSAIGFNDIVFVFVFSWLSQLALLFYSIGILGFITVVFIYLIRRLKMTFESEILKPLMPDFSGTSQIEEIQTIIDKKCELEKYKVNSAVGEALNTLAAQLSHDIRSPLAALNMMLGQIKNLPEPQRVMMRSAITRISDIANELLVKRKEITSQSTGAIADKSDHGKVVLKIELLSPLIDVLVSEKRIQFREKQNIEIGADIDQGYGLFANINGTEFKRTLSNILNNSCEAFPEEKGQVNVTVCGDAKFVSVIVQDNGKGIPPYILEKLGQMGVSHGKEGTQSGSGLGVYHAKKTIESFAGQFEIASVEGSGTKISMHFPRVKAPKWFVEKLSLMPYQQVISLDDDLSIHGIWKGRFESQRLQEIGFQHLTFTSGQEFKDWFSKQSSNLVSRLYLVDYELLNQKQTGLEIIEELGIGSQSILVTSRYEEDKIREKCERLRVRLIPKTMAAFVPIEIEKAKVKYDVALLDDDFLVEATWKMAAEAKNKTMIYFSSPEDFFKNAQGLDFEIPIYVDSNLGYGIKGEEISKKIFEMGFQNIWLCTGYQASDFPPMPHIKGIVPKDPIF